MEVEGRFETEVVEVLQVVGRVREEGGIPGVAGPADALAEFILGRVRAPERPGLVPVHVEDHHVDRDAEGADLLAEVHEFEVGILPEPAPPVAEGILRRQGNAPGHLREIADGSLVIMAVGEHVEVLPVAGRAVGNPVLPVALHGDEHLAGALVDDGPAVTGSDAFVKGIPCLGVVTRIAVERAGRAEQVPAVVHAGMPGDLLGNGPALLVGTRGEAECNGQVPFVELAVAFVGQGHIGGPDGDFLPGAADLEGRDGQPAVHDAERRPVLEQPVLRPFHPDQPGSQDGEAGVAGRDDGAGVGQRVIRHGRDVAKLLFSKDLADESGFIGRDTVHAEADHRADVLLPVHGPDIDAHAEVMGFRDPLGMLVEVLVVVVDAVDAFGVERCRGDVAVEVLDRKAGGLGDQLFADIHAEGDEDRPGRVEEPVRLQRGDGLVGQPVLARLVLLFLQFDDEDGLRCLFALGEVFVQGRDRLAVLQAESLERRVGIVPDPDPLVVVVVMDQDNVVAGQLEVEFAAPQVLFLGRPEGRDGVLGPLGRL